MGSDDPLPLKGEPPPLFLPLRGEPPPLFLRRAEVQSEAYWVPWILRVWASWQVLRPTQGRRRRRPYCSRRGAPSVQSCSSRLHVHCAASLWLARFAGSGRPHDLRRSLGCELNLCGWVWFARDLLVERKPAWVACTTDLKSAFCLRPPGMCPFLPLELPRSGCSHGSTVRDVCLRRYGLSVPESAGRWHLQCAAGLELAGSARKVSGSRALPGSGRSHY